MTGRNGFSTLVRLGSPGARPERVLAVLKRYGTISVLRSKKCRLEKPLFFTTADSHIAFEPAIRFLSDASVTLGALIRREPKKSKRASLNSGNDQKVRLPKMRPFWRMVDNINMSQAAARKFMVFVRERSQTFLEEVDDWLGAQSDSRVPASRAKRACRVGLGMFSIYSQPYEITPEELLGLHKEKGRRPSRRPKNAETT